MTNVISILRRDLGAYFTSPIGYIFMMVFVTISVGLYITAFFTYPVADMRPYFDNLPLLLCVFIPAVTMRIWAEERKENTWEMLLTFPMRAWELVLGKFFAALIFFALTLFATVTVPAMLFSLGSPDVGVILSGYLGTFLLGAFFLALGIFFSGFFKDQIVAFVVTLLTCFIFFLLGTTFIASYIDDRIPGFGTLLSNLLGLFKHYTSFTRGVIDLADILYFLAWTVLFLALNILYIDGRSRPGSKTLFSAAVTICLAIGLLFNYIMVGQSFLRLDVTEDKIYTISDGAKAILQEIDTPVQVKVYITPRDKMPTQMKDLEQNIIDKLEELRVASSGKIEYTPVYMEVANVIAAAQEMDDDEEKTEEEAIEKRMLDKGVEPFNVQAMSQDEITNRLIYSSIGVGFRDKPEEILPRIMPQNLLELEYMLVSTIYKLTQEDSPVVALVAPKEAVNIDPQMRAILQQMGQPIPQSEDPYEYLERILQTQKYDVRRVELTKESPLPDEYDTLAVINPRDLNERQRWEIDRALRSGKSVILATQKYEWEYRATARGNTVTRRDENPGVNELLSHYGVEVDTNILMDPSSVTLSVQTGNILQDIQGGQPFNLPMHILVNNDTMDPETSITSRLSNIFYLWGTALQLDDDKLESHGLEKRILMTSSPQAWTVPADAPMSQDSFTPPVSGRKAYPLMAMIEGTFPDAFAEQGRPAWPKPQQQPGQPPMPDLDDDTPEAPAPEIEVKPGRLILLGCAEMFRKNFLQAGNLDLFLNSVDAVTLNEHLVNVRSRKPIERRIAPPTEGQKTMWRLANYGLANVVIAAVGVSLFLARRRARNEYTMAQIRARKNS